VDYNREILNPLVASWLGKVQEAKRNKSRFSDTADQCMGFFAGSCGFMWQTDFLKKYIGEMVAPRFKITIAKAFELVALYGPTLYWRNPTRLVKPRKKLELDPAVFGGLDPTGFMLYQQLQQEEHQQGAVDDAVSQLIEMYLNYTPGEQPGGGLATHSSDAITEALVKGRGCLWVRPYFQPGSSKVLTGCFYDSVDNLFIDPDAQSLHDAKYIIQQCTQPTWEVERQFGLPTDSLKGKGSHESGDGQGRSVADPWSATDRRVGKSFDLLTYYKIWSKGGIGGRLAGPAQIDQQLSRAFDQVVGDYAYIVVAPGVPFPLNAPTELVRSATDSEIQKRFRWPVPYWLDDRWPVCVLDFYRHPNSAWPIAPMAPGLGELAYLNILISQLANHVYTSSRTLFAAPDDIDSNIENQVRNGADWAYLKYRRSSMANSRLQDQIGFIQHPPLNPDSWRIVEQISAMFDRRTGLSELLYGLNPGGVQSRTAEDIAVKKEMTNIRPDYMAGKVEDWMTDAADMEKLCCRWFVEADDVSGMFGRTELMLWDRLIVNADPEQIVREMRATVAANSTRKPDKSRDTQNMQQLMQSVLPVLDQYLQMTGNPGPLNALLHQFGKTIDQDLSEMLLPPPQQGEDPEAQMAAQEQQMALEQHQQELMQDAQNHQMKLGQGQQQMIHAQQKHQMAMHQTVHKMRLDAEKTKTSNQVAKQKAKQRPKARAA
jgi:hypothetical protein